MYGVPGYALGLRRNMDHRFGALSSLLESGGTHPTPTGFVPLETGHCTAAIWLYKGTNPNSAGPRTAPHLRRMGPLPTARRHDSVSHETHPHHGMDYPGERENHPIMEQHYLGVLGNHHRPAYSQLGHPPPQRLYGPPGSASYETTSRHV